MELFAFLISAALGGLIVGALARLAIPGRDPMPLWTTMLLGIGGSLVGGFVAGLLLGADAYGWAFSFAVGAASVLLGLHRSFVQRRPLFGPGARRRGQQQCLAGPKPETTRPWEKSSDSSSEA